MDLPSPRGDRGVPGLALLGDRESLDADTDADKRPGRAISPSRCVKSSFRCRKDREPSSFRVRVDGIIIAPLFRWECRR
jgi:hypothetical protein